MELHMRTVKGAEVAGPGAQLDADQRERISL